MRDGVGDGIVAGSASPHELVPASVAQALQMAGTAVEYLNSPAADQLETAALGEVLAALGDL